MTRPVIPILATIALVSACGDDPDAASGPPIIRVTAGLATGGAESAAMSPAVGDKMMIRPAAWRFEVSGDLPSLDSSAWAWVLPAGARPTDEQLQTLLDSFDVSGRFSERVEGRGESWEYTNWVAGSSDGSGASITVSNDALLSWWYSEGYGDVVATPECLGPPEVAGTSGDASSDGAAASGSGEAGGTSIAAGPCGAPIETPRGVPSKDEAIAKFRDLVVGLGYDSDSLVTDAYADDWSAGVTGWVLLDGVRSSLMVSASYGENGRLTYASGTLAVPEKFAEYPRIGTTAAVERLTREYNGMWDGSGGPMVRGGGIAIDPGIGGSVAGSAAIEPMPAETIPVESMPAETIPVETIPVDVIPIDSTPIEPETITVSIERVEEELVYVWSADGSVYLVPGYAFVTTQDGYESRYLVSAVPDEYIEQVPASDEVATPTTDVPSTDVPSTDVAVPGVVISDADAQSLVGLDENEAVTAAEDRGWTARVVARDGEQLPITMDYSTSRVDLTVVDGVVTEVYVG